MSTIVTPVDANKLKLLLEEANYDKEETQFLYQGFTLGFPLGYKSPTNRKTEANDLKLRIGDHIDLWNKVMKEVEAKRVYHLITIYNHLLGLSPNMNLDSLDSSPIYLTLWETL